MVDQGVHQTSPLAFLSLLPNVYSKVSSLWVYVLPRVYVNEFDAIHDGFEFVGLFRTYTKV